MHSPTPNRTTAQRPPDKRPVAATFTAFTVLIERRALTPLIAVTALLGSMFGLNGAQAQSAMSSKVAADLTSVVAASTTPRPRPFAAAALKRSIQINGITGLCITKLDVLDGMETVKLCTGYTLDGAMCDLLPPGADGAAACTPVYEDMPGWLDTTVGITRFDALPTNAQNYLRRLEAACGAPIALISTGPERDETIVLSHPFD